MLAAWRAGLTVADACRCCGGADEIGIVCGCARAEGAARRVVNSSGEKHERNALRRLPSRSSRCASCSASAQPADGVTSLDEVLAGRTTRADATGRADAPPDHFHRTGRRAAGARVPREESCSRKGRSRCSALSLSDACDVILNPYPLHWAGRAFARAHAVAGQRGHPGPASPVRLSPTSCGSFSPAGRRSRRCRLPDPCRARQGRRAAPSLPAAYGGSARCGRRLSSPRRRRRSTAPHRSSLRPLSAGRSRRRRARRETSSNPALPSARPACISKTMATAPCSWKRSSARAATGTATRAPAARAGRVAWRRQADRSPPTREGFVATGSLRCARGR